MNDGSMFQPIEQTLDQANFDAMDTVYYLTPDATYKLTPLFTARVEKAMWRRGRPISETRPLCSST